MKLSITPFSLWLWLCVVPVKKNKRSFFTEELCKWPLEELHLVWGVCSYRGGLVKTAHGLPGVSRASCIQLECGEGNNRLILFLPLKFVCWFKSAELNFKHPRGDKMSRYGGVRLKVKERSYRILLCLFLYFAVYFNFSPLVWKTLPLSLKSWCWVGFMIQSHLRINIICIFLNGCLLLFFFFFFFPVTTLD